VIGDTEMAHDPQQRTESGQVQAGVLHSSALRPEAGKPGGDDARGGVPVRLVDERLTTVSAERVLRERGKKGAKRRAVVDQAAAVVILQHVLDTERASGTAPGEIIEENDTP